MKYITLGVIVLGLLGGIPLIRWYEEASRPMMIVQEVQAQEPEPKVVLIEVRPTIPPVLERIADCESGERKADGTAVRGSGRQFDENGEVIIGKMNRPELGVDVGKYQINSVFHTKHAEELGLDLYNEHDNEAYALALYRENGTKPWRASRNCWSVVE